MDYFSRLLALTTQDGNFDIHTKCERLKISHLAFVDDLMIYGRGDYGSMKIIAEALEESGSSKLLILGAFGTDFFGSHISLQNSPSFLGWLVGSLVYQGWTFLPSD